MTIKNADMPAMPITDESGMPFNGLPVELSTVGITKRETFCLHMGIAETGDSELDAIIRKGNRKKMATQAMQGLLAGRFIDNSGHVMSEIPCRAAKIADALLAELERTK